MTQVTQSKDEREYNSIVEMLERATKLFEKNRAFTICLPNGITGSLTFGELDVLSRAFAVYLTQELSLPVGTRVAVQLPNCLAFPVCALGVLRAGCVLVNVNPLYTETELLHQLKDSDSRVLVVIDLFANKLAQVRKSAGIEHVLLVNIADFMPAPLRFLVYGKQKLSKEIPTPPIAVDSFRRVVEQSIHKVATIDSYPSAEAGKLEHLRARKRGDVAMLQYTGGTTGVSKGAILTHGNVIANVAQLDHACGYRFVPGAEVMLTALPLYHIFAFTVNFLFLYTLGAENILIPSPRPINNLLPAFRKRKVSAMSGVNTLYQALLNDPSFRAAPPRSLKVVVSGGSSLQRPTAEEWEKVVGVPIIEGYGLSETSPVVCINPFDGTHRLESIGRAVQGTEVVIMDDDGHELTAGNAGEIAVRGPQVMQGYWNQPEETARAMRHGWFLTGDIGVMDNEGFVRILDRKKEMIIVSGFNVYPNEVEARLVTMPGVREAAVVGLPDDKTGERVHAAIVPLSAKEEDLPTLEDVRAYCAQWLTKYKLPTSVSFAKELPKTPVGKVLRRQVRASLLEHS